MFVAVISWHTILHIYILTYVLGARAASKLFLNFFLVLSTYGKCNASMHRWEHVS